MAKVEMTLEFPDFKEFMEQERRRIDMAIAATLQTNRGMLFDKEGAHNGHEKWAPLAYREGQILSLKGTLRKSIAPTRADGTAGEGGYVDIQRDSIAIGTNIYYAAMMNWGTTQMPGGVMTPKNKQALAFKIGGKSVIVKSIKIPARHFDEWNDQDQTEVTATVTNIIEDILQRRANGQG